LDDAPERQASVSIAVDYLATRVGEDDPYLPERRLYAAILTQAVADLTITRGRLARGRLLRDRADRRARGEAGVRGESHGLERTEAEAYDSALRFLFYEPAFAAVAQGLGLDPDILREGVRRRHLAAVGAEVLFVDLLRVRPTPGDLPATPRPKGGRTRLRRAA